MKVPPPGLRLRNPVLLIGLAALAVVGALVALPRSSPSRRVAATAAPTPTTQSTVVTPTSAGRQSTAPRSTGSLSSGAGPTPAASPSTGHSSSSTTVARRPAAAVPTVYAAPRPPVNLGQKVVVIDPGHDGGNGSHTAEINRLVPAGGFMKACDTTGTETNAGYTEAAFNLDVAHRLAADLLQQGVTVVMTRTTDTGWGPCVNQRADIGNQAHADAAISIHADGGPPSGRGFHVIQPALLPGYTDNIVAPSHRLALDVLASFLSGTGMPPSTYIGSSGLDTRADLGGLNLSQVPKVFVECGNMRNGTDAALLSSPAFRQKVADALAAGMATYLAS